MKKLRVDTLVMIAKRLVSGRRCGRVEVYVDEEIGHLDRTASSYLFRFVKTTLPKRQWSNEAGRLVEVQPLKRRVVKRHLRLSEADSVQDVAEHVRALCCSAAEELFPVKEIQPAKKRPHTIERRRIGCAFCGASVSASASQCDHCHSFLEASA